MRVTLKDFQVEAVDLLRTRADRAGGDVEDEGAQSLVLSAPTGSGKTIMAAAWMERLVEGDERFDPDPHATFLWLTDQPALNEQTRRKLETGCTVFAPSQLVTIESGFDQETFDPGCVYFLNTQKLARSSTYVRLSDKRNFTLWQTIARTAAERPTSFWVVIDEAHKGMSQTAEEREVAQTIMQRFIIGSEDIPAMPLILGISATPERFTNLLAGTPRTTRPPVVVDPEAVRASGLIKDDIILYHPEEAQHSDLTLLKAAAEQLKQYEAEWHGYSAREKAPSVRPVLVVQVENEGANQVTRTNLTDCLSVLEEVLGPLGDAGVAHSFQEGTPVLAGDERRIRYVAPADVQDDVSLRVVFFKLSLTTGWDCPRAEVMMSFRRANDPVAIAQLVGRMVRTPLARSVSASEFLNSVCLHLPYYDEEAVEDIIKRLTEPDPEIGFPTRVQRGEKLITLERNPDIAEAFAAAEQLPTYHVERVSKLSNTRRLLKLGRLLAWDKLDPDAPKNFTAALVAVLDDERKKVEGSEAFDKRLKEAGSIDVRAVTVAYGATEASSVTSTQLAAVSQNIEQAFGEAGRKLGGGLHSAYLRARAAGDTPPAVSAIKLELYALVLDGDVVKRVQEKAGELVNQALEQHKVARRTLPDERRQLYRQIARQAEKPEAEPWELPTSIQASKDGDTTLDRHMYVSESGTFTTKLNDWERDTLKEALADENAVAWLRNDPRKPWSFTLPYESGNQFKPMYPDFLVFRRQDGGIVCDILEPHALSWEDSAAKARGLAGLARDHGEDFGRIELIAKLGGTYKRLSLNDPETRDKVLGVATGEHLRQLFAAS